ncbi:CheY-like chemotaxis protein [Arcticibacter pallidicorallinus]|uniref:CheY-like chemotaxis protein n=1 Tax=Arcticibacter pallidicorallinus TaxID=1259464 RepID=A0A2T0U718_9SPHI|nr:response regulator [Arcticibacter pallidicorallinus]PRY53658.1 CheY-like chemotaxis protein [Arcticibacter pallidicorallinus]
MDNFKYKSVLLIDDSYVDNLINSKIIESLHFADEVKIINSPFEAINYLKDAARTGELPDIIFLDIRMPAMNGFEFMNKLEPIKHLLPSNLKIYMLSSSLDPSDLRKVKENNLVTNFIGKPLTARALEEI